ncbi:MAG: hypothetical protein H6550_08890 [Chitinophagales bacterium]|nr:hypothetical protein [Chitinophagales bacterium]
MKRIILLTTVLLTVNCTLPVETLAQGPGFPDAPVDTPFDGGVTLIAAAAAGYGIKKMSDKKNNKR